MNKWLRRAAGTVGVAGGFLLLAGGAAQADAPTSDAALAPGGLIHNLFTPLGATNLGLSVDVPGTTVDAGLLPDGPLALVPNDGRIGVTAHTLTKNGVPQAVFFNGKLPDVLGMLPIQGLVPPGIIGPVTSAATGAVGGLTHTLSDTTQTAAGFQAPTTGVRNVTSDVSNTLVGSPTEGLPLVGGLVDNLPVVGGLLGDNGPLGNLPVVGSLLNGAGGGLPIVGGLLQNLPLVGGLTQGLGESTDATPTTEGLPIVGGLLQNLPVVGGLTNSLPLVGGGDSGDALGGLPVVGGLVQNLPVVGGLLNRDANGAPAGASSGGDGLLGGSGGPLNGLVAGLPLASSLPLVGNESTSVAPTEGLPLVGGLLQNLPIVGGLTNSLPLVGGGDSGDGLGGLPIVGGLVQNLPLVGGLTNNLPDVGGLTNSLPVIGNVSAVQPTTTGPDVAVSNNSQVTGFAAPTTAPVSDTIAPPSGRSDAPDTATGRPVADGQTGGFVGTKTNESAHITEGLPLVGGLPIVGGLLGGQGGLPIVGGLLQNLPIVGGLASGLPLVGGLMGGAPSADPGAAPSTDRSAGGLISSLPVPLGVVHSLPSL